MSSYSSITKAFKSDDVKKKVTVEEAEKAVETLIAWIGDDPKREGLLETPKRVIKSFNEHFAGYKENPSEILSKTFKEIQGYDDIVVLKKIDFESHCEHHMLPIIGNASVGYLPNKSIVGISKLARIACLRAIVSNPNALLLDEPFSSLDKKTMKSFQKFLFDYVKKLNIPCIIVSHRLVENLNNSIELNITKFT